jgi:hypothetical protein
MTQPVLPSNDETKLFSSIGNEILYYTPLVFYLDLAKVAHPLGSCVLLKWNDIYFLVMAGHTAKDFHTKYHGRFFTMLGSKKVAIQTEGFMNTRPRNGDNVDVYVSRLTHQCSFILMDAGYKFFDIKDMDIDHDDLEGRRYMVVGFPVTKIKNKNLTQGPTFISNPFIYITWVNNKASLLKKLKLEPHNLIVNYQKRKITSSKSMEVSMGPSPVGLSGCGIWCVDDNSKYYPAAILTDYFVEHNALIGTRIQLVTEALRIHFAPDIPMSNKIRMQ